MYHQRVKLLADYKRELRGTQVLRGIFGVTSDDLKSLSVTSTRKQLSRKLMDGIPAIIEENICAQSIKTYFHLYSYLSKTVHWLYQPSSG